MEEKMKAMEKKRQIPFFFLHKWRQKRGKPYGK